MKKVIDYTQTAFYIFQYNTRKINAIIKRSQIHRIKLYIMLFCMLVSYFNNIFAIENNNIPYGQKDIRYNLDEKSYITYNGIRQKNTEYYYIENGKEYTAYCVDLGLNGAECSKEGHYTINANEKIEEKVLKDIILNCYPYRTVEELGVATVDEAKFASQFAIWCYTAKLNLDNMAPTSQEYSRVASCIRNIYSIGMNGYNSDVTLDFNVTPQYIEFINGIEYYVKEIEIINANNIRNFELLAKDENVNITCEGDRYRVYVPVDYVDKSKSISVELEEKMVAKENVALLGGSNNPEYQRVAVMINDAFDYTEKINLTFTTDKSRIVVKKVDKETSEPLEGVVYDVEYDNGEKIGEFVTDENGEFEIVLRNNEKCVINIKEKQEKEFYSKDYGVHKVEVNLQENKLVVLTNEKKKGTIEIIKKSKEYNQITGYLENTPLKGVSFYVYDEKGNMVDDITTDEYGQAKTKFLKSGVYYIEEYATIDGYKLLEGKKKVEISYPGENVQVIILNENIDIPKKMPVTGR